jgi:hypothetical protein
VLYASDGSVNAEYDSAMSITVSPSHGPLKLEVSDHFVYSNSIAMPANATDHYMRASYPSMQEVQRAPIN